MPNRIIKESICTSEKISALSDFEFRLWIGLITQADDAGRGDARPAVVKGRIFPFRERLTLKDIDAALASLAASNCISLYDVGGVSYYWFPNWSKHQRVRDCKPKYPEPPACGKLPQSAASCGELRPESNPIQSNISSLTLPGVSVNAGGDEKRKHSAFEHDSEAYKAAKYLGKRIKQNLPTHPEIDEQSLQRWADSMDKLHRIDKQSWDDISAVLAFSQSDAFWRGNILSGKKFREKFFTLLAKKDGAKDG